MPPNYLHNLKEFPALLQILETETGILSQLIEKDYWIMHVLYGLQQQGFEFELKGGTSLSKGYHIIDRFSEDIDIHIKPLKELNVNVNPKNTKPASVASRKNYYDWLAKEIKIDGIASVVRDTNFDDESAYRSGGIRLLYNSTKKTVAGLKEGILLEAGFDTITPNIALTISSWAYDRAADTSGLNIIDNRAIDIPCYHPGYTFVEKLQTIASKFSQEQSDGIARPNLMRQYYDIYCLLESPIVQAFIGTDAYHTHKRTRFPKVDFDIPINENNAFNLRNSRLREDFNLRYRATEALYYSGQPNFNQILKRIERFVDVL